MSFKEIMKDLSKSFGWALYSAKTYRGYVELCAFVFSIGPAGFMLGSMLLHVPFGKFHFIGISAMASAYLCASLLIHKRLKDTIFAGIFLVECIAIFYAFVIVVPDEWWVVAMGSVAGAILGVIHGKELTAAVNREVRGTRW